MNNNQSPELINQVIGIWSHNRILYPGWLVFPFGKEWQELSWRTNRWEQPIIDALPELAPIKRLEAIRELVWRREILLEPINANLEAAAENMLLCVDCEKRTIDGVKVSHDDWPDVQEALRVAVFALITDARLTCNKDLFDKRIHALTPFIRNDDSEVGHHIKHEQCLWAIYSLDFEKLNELLDDWTVKNCDPVWLLRKAAMLTEIRRYEASARLIQSALGSLRSLSKGEKSIANASREGWALASTLTFNNQQLVFREWQNLARQRCDPNVVIDHIRRSLKGATQPQDPPHFDVGRKQATSLRLSGSSYVRMIAAYRAVLLPEVTGLSPVNNPGHDNFPMSMVSDLLTSAAEELVSTNPQLSMRLILRISASDKDKVLERVFSRRHLATLPDSTLADLAQICFRVILYVLPRTFLPDESLHGISWIERMRVTVEILSRLVLRLPSSMVCKALDIGLDCYQNDQFTGHPWLVLPLNNLLARSWEALPQDLRTTRVFDLLTAPIKRWEEHTVGQRRIDLGHLIGDNDIPAERTPGNEELYYETVELLVGALRSGHAARKCAIFRLLPLTVSEILSEDETSAIANSLWDNSDAVFANPQDPDSPRDWVFLVLPEKEAGKAEQSFRQKWLTPSTDSQDSSIDYSVNLLVQVHGAVFGLPQHKRSFSLSEAEEHHIAHHIELLVEMFSSNPGSFTFGIKSELLSIARLATAITIPKPIASKLSSRIDQLLEPVSIPGDFGLGDYRVILGFAIIPGLIKVMPECFESLNLRIKTGLASEDPSHITGATAALWSWLSASTSSTSNLRSVPNDLVREVGSIIASDRRTALAEALSCAILVFDEGTQTHKETISSLVLQGLAALARKLRYVRNQEWGEDGTGDDFPTLRLLCAQLAMSMARNGFDSDATIRNWLDICRDDPFPEVRNVVIPDASG